MCRHGGGRCVSRQGKWMHKGGCSGDTKRRQWMHKAKAVSQPRRQVNAQSKCSVCTEWMHKAKTVNAQRKGGVSAATWRWTHKAKAVCSVETQSKGSVCTEWMHKAKAVDAQSGGCTEWVHSAVTERVEGAGGAGQRGPGVALREPAQHPEQVARVRPAEYCPAMPHPRTVSAAVGGVRWGKGGGRRACV